MFAGINVSASPEINLKSPFLFFINKYNMIPIIANAEYNRVSNENAEKIPAKKNLCRLVRYKLIIKNIVVR